MKKLLNILLALCFFCALPAVCGENTTEQAQFLEDTKAVIAIQKQPSQDANQKQTVQNIRWAIVIQVQGKALDTANSDNK